MEGRSESNFFPLFFFFWFTIINMFLFHFLHYIWKRKSEYPFIVETKALFKHLDFELIPQISQLSLQLVCATVPMQHSLADSLKYTHITLLTTHHSLFLLLSYISWSFALFKLHNPEQPICGLSKHLSDICIWSSVGRDLSNIPSAPDSPPSSFPVSSFKHEWDARVGSTWLGQKRQQKGSGLARKLPKSNFTSRDSQTVEDGSIH